MKPLYSAACALLALVLLPTASAQFVTDAPAQVSALDNDPDARYTVFPLFTIGEEIDGYIPPGIPDGMGAGILSARTARLFVSHELTEEDGYLYTLANGTNLSGARISAFDVDRRSGSIRSAGPAYDTVIDRAGLVVTNAEQINEGNGPTEGFSRFCSATGFAAGQYGLVDPVYFAGEETSDNGQLVAVDARRQTLYVVPMAGRAAWENVTLMDTGDPDRIAMLIGDDRGGAGLLLYVGEKNAVGDDSFLDRNGLAMGDLYVWKADNGDTTPADWNATGTSRTGTFVRLSQFNASQAGEPGFDPLGYADLTTIDAQRILLDAFEFSRPEDLATNPADGTQVAFTSTGRSSLFPEDEWGTVYLVDFDFSGIADGDIDADIVILYSGDDAGAGQFPGPDFGLRSPDNLDWADDGQLYLQEDASTSNFGTVSGLEARIWKLDPATGDLVDIAVVNRGDDALPADQTDADPDEIGAWETSGIFDVTELFTGMADLKVFLFNVQAHTVIDGRIAENNLEQGGQIAYLLARSRASRLADVDLDGLSFSDALAALGVEAESAVVGRTPRLTAEATALALDAYPNPFGSATTLGYALPETGTVTVTVYDVLGRQVATLVDGEVEAGTHTVRLDAAGLAPGTYLVRLQAGDQELTQDVTLVK